MLDGRVRASITMCFVIVSVYNNKQIMAHASKKNHLIDISKYIFLGLLAYMPLHIFLSTWLGTSFGLLDILKNAKDVVLVVGFLCVVTAGVKNINWKQFFASKIVWLITLYCLLNILLGIVKRTDQDAEILGVVYGTRFFVFFLYGALLAQLVDAKKLLKQAVITVLSVAFLVLTFGVVQYVLLPNNALTHVGYSRANGVLPAFFIDEKPDLERVMSTLRDPNSFGSYVIIIGTLVIAAAGIKKSKQYLQLPTITAGRFNVIALLMHALVGLCLWFSFSRSAWIGFIASLVAYFMLAQYAFIKAHIKKIVPIAVLLILLALLPLYTFRNSYLVQNVLLHRDQSTVLEDPNQLRVRFWQESIDAINNNPWGYGPGTAGLPSIRNNVQGTVLTENYYLQIGYEIGIAGIALFLSICALVGYSLYQLRGNKIARALLASFTGLVVTNFLVHIWANEAVAFTWWGLAGILFLQHQSLKQQPTR